MSIPTVPPPTYDQQHDQGRSQPCALSSTSNEPPLVPSEAQLLISPSASAARFQNGYLGANGERAAIEGELQIKGVPVMSWESLSISLCSTESAGEEQIELNSSVLELYSRNQPSGSSLSNVLTVASSIPFSIPLPPDTPQCLHIGRFSISHVLTAVLKTTDPSLPLLVRSVPAHTRRFTSHLLHCDVQPLIVSLSHPTPVDVQVPRTFYRLSEPIPVYVTIPPPDRSVILDHGFTLRSVRAELIRSVKLANANNENDLSSNEATTAHRDEDDDSDSVSSFGEPPSAEFSSSFAGNGSTSYVATHFCSTESESLAGSDSLYETILARSGSSCRFHTSRSVKLRLVLHGGVSNGSPNHNTSQLSDVDDSFQDNDSQCASSSQSTLLHTVEFRIQVRVTYLHVSTRSEQTYSLTIPVTILPPPAPLPEVDSSIDSAYLKKHDRPPLKTVRLEDSDVYSGDYDTSQPGPSASAHGAPPPFDDAPPPFFSLGEASTSSRLPTFFESESEIIIPSADHPASVNTLPLAPGGTLFEGEGVLFGFSQSERYDGHSDESARSSTPPPSLEMAVDDANVTDLADLVDQPERAMDALNLALEQHEERRSGEMPPPPPPPMDDPLDPPPSIDSDFRSHDLDPPPSILSTDFTTTGMVGTILPLIQPSPAIGRAASSLSEPPAVLDVSSRIPSVPEESSAISPSHAPPPYLNPASIGDAEHVSGPPPYVDLVPSNVNTAR
ncbi:hypothetical protein EW145_g6422 [Phellinidium pouzarii]|uniref:Uncharacterized protein n=1 Tax=Phellinidium pouzarii TaxID=167371 RepID=A0A4S4KWU8_9AGAM|nr:hypothetical protein EW145_g6422 [Phellinidium pouzarii]